MNTENIINELKVLNSKIAINSPCIVISYGTDDTAEAAIIQLSKNNYAVMPPFSRQGKLQIVAFKQNKIQGI